MSVVEGGPASGLVQRVQDLLLRPTPTWDKIDGEPATIKGLYTGYVCVLAAVPAVCEVIGRTSFGHAFFGPGALVASLIGYGLALVAVYVLALVIDALAPSFGGERNRIQAFKVAAYSGTAGWLAGVFSLVPMLGFLAVLGLYDLYLLYRGLSKLMRVPENQALGYTVVVVIAMLVIGAIVTGIVTSTVVIMAGGAIGMGALMGAMMH